MELGHTAKYILTITPFLLVANFVVHFLIIFVGSIFSKQHDVQTMTTQITNAIAKRSIASRFAAI